MDKLDILDLKFEKAFSKVAEKLSKDPEHRSLIEISKMLIIAKEFYSTFNNDTEYNKIKNMESFLDCILDEHF